MQHLVPIKRWLTALLSATLGFSALAADEQAQDDRKLKAVYLFNFIRFIDWSDAHFANRDDAIRLCVGGDAGFMAMMQKLTAGRTIGKQQRKIEVHYSTAKSADNNCHLSYIRNQSEALAQAGSKALKVGDSPALAEFGTAINFFYEGQRLRFEVLPGHLQQGVSVSSELMKLAQIKEEE